MKFWQEDSVHFLVLAFEELSSPRLQAWPRGLFGVKKMGKNEKSKKTLSCKSIDFRTFPRVWLCCSFALHIILKFVIHFNLNPVFSVIWALMASKRVRFAAEEHSAAAAGERDARKVKRSRLDDDDDEADEEGEGPETSTKRAKKHTLDSDEEDEADTYAKLDMEKVCQRNFRIFFREIARGPKISLKNYAQKCFPNRIRILLFSGTGIEISQGSLLMKKFPCFFDLPDLFNLCIYIFGLLRS